ncbi:MAG TPA: apolipoprotein N-acyltransferase, partial [Verrucomicrobiae bacterium]
QGIPFGPALGWVALSAFLALFTAVWVWVVSIQTRVQQASLLPETWVRRFLWMTAGAAAWVGIEMVLARILGGFPWNLLGVSQYKMTPLIQVASVTGVYGVSFLVVWVSLALLSAAQMLIRRPNARSALAAEVFIPVLVAAAVFNIGFRQIRSGSAQQRTMKVLLIQPSIPQNLIWDPGQNTNRFAELVAYSDRALTNNADLLIWPESAIPEMLRYETNTFNAISNLALKHHVWMIVGSDDMEPKRGARESGGVDYFNSSFLISPEGLLAERYLKRSLVIFGEYVPWQRWLPFLKWLVPFDGGYTSGKESTEFNLPSLGLKTSVLICFEDIFPQLARTDVKSDTDFLVNITNDGWFGHSAAQWQHATTALFRAVENRLPLIRCCNNGLTCWVDAFGRIRQLLRDDHGTVYGMGYLRAEIPMPSAGQTHPLTFYTRHGDVFGWGCVVVAVLFVACNYRHWKPAASR